MHLSDEGKVTAVAPESILLTVDYPKSGPVALKVAEWNAKADEMLDIPLGCSIEPLDAREESVRKGQSNTGNLFCDALRYAYQTDIAVYNGGGIRSNSIIPAGEISERTLITLSPFGNTVVTFKISGKLLRTYISNGLNCIEEQCGHFPQISGFNYTFSPNKPKGSRLISLTRQDGRPIADDDEFTAATIDFLYQTSDLKEAPLWRMESIQSDALTFIDYTLKAYIEQAGNACISPVVDGRIQEIFT